MPTRLQVFKNLPFQKAFLLANLVWILVLIIWQGPYGLFWTLALTILLFFLTGRNWNYVGLGNCKWSRSILHAIPWAIGIFLFADVLIQPFIERIFGVIDLSGFAWLKGNLKGYLVFSLIMWVVAGIGEELAFRGFIQKQIAFLLGDNKNAWILGALISSVYFGLAHMYQGWSGVISTGLIGFILALIFIKNKQNLIQTMFIHGFYDMIGLTLLYLDMERILVDPVTRFFFG